MSLLRSIGSFVLALLLAFGIVAAAAVLPVIVYSAGVLIPRYLIGDGVDQFRGEKREMARSIYQGVAYFSEEAPFMFAHRVESVKKCPGAQPTPTPISLLRLPNTNLFFRQRLRKKF